MTIYYLYVKTHLKTNQKYLGYTKQNPFVYKGSGKLWTRHIKKHGNQVWTNIIFQTELKEEIIEKGVYYSKLWNIVESSEWKNLKEETGDGGSVKGEDNYNYGKPKSKEAKLKMSISKKEKYKGENHPLYGKKHKEKSKQKMSISKKGENNPMYGIKGEKHPLYGKLISESHKQKISNGLSGKNIGEKNHSYGKHWYTNGLDNKLYFHIEVPDGWIRGRIFQPN